MTDKRRLTREERIELGFLEGVRSRMPDDYQVLSALGELYTRAGRFRDGLEVDERLTTLAPSDAVVWYNLACSQALLEQRDAALGSLRQAIDLGYDDLELLRTDRDLDNLRGRAAFTRMLEELENRSG